MVARLQQEYNDKLRPQLQKQFGYKNIMQVPRLEKIVINMGVGRSHPRHEKGR